MAELQPREPFDRAVPQPKGGDVFSALAGRFGVTVPHEWWPSVHLLKSFEAAGFSHVQVDAPPLGVLERDPPPDAARRRPARGAGHHRLGAGRSCSGGPSPRDRGRRQSDGRADRLRGRSRRRAGRLPRPRLRRRGGERRSDSVRDRPRFAGPSAGPSFTDFAIAIENLAPLFPGREVISANPMSLRSLVRQVGSESLGVCLDLGHAHISAQLARPRWQH